MQAHSFGRWAVTSLGAAGVAMTMAATPAAACSGDYGYIGAICMTATQFCPRGFVRAEGQMMAISENQALAALFGTAYGGDGQTTFGIPDLRGRTPAGRGATAYLPALDRGDKAGLDSRTLTLAQLPSHTHDATYTHSPNSKLTVSAFDGIGASPTPSTQNSHLQTVGANALIPNTEAKLYGSGQGTAVPLSGVDLDASATPTLQDTGSGKAVSLRGPGMGMTYCVATQGLWPPRPQ